MEEGMEMKLGDLGSLLIMKGPTGPLKTFKFINGGAEWKIEVKVHLNKYH